MRPDDAITGGYREARATVRILGPPDHAAAVALAHGAFDGNEFYESALGIDGAHLRAYWEEFLHLALHDAGARVYGLEREGALRGMIVSAFHGFPDSRSGARFLARLLWRIGPLRCWRYLAFVHDYDRALRPVERCPAREARCYWLMVAPGRGAGLGRALVAEVRRALWSEGKGKAFGFIDASNGRLETFYRRLGFTIGKPFAFRGRRAATIAIATEAPGRKLPCCG
jgi:ribosomal protein S18 acetylase RimI-like enzyme